MYGPVPTGAALILAESPPLASRNALLPICSVVKATLDKKAGSGLHSVNFTVYWSTASIDFISPPYLQSGAENERGVKAVVVVAAVAATVGAVVAAAVVGAVVAAGAVVGAVVAAGAAVGAVVAAGAEVGAGAWVSVGAAVGVAAGAQAPTNRAATTATPNSRDRLYERFILDFSSRDSAEYVNVAVW